MARIYVVLLLAIFCVACSPGALRTPAVAGPATPVAYPTPAVRAATTAYVPAGGPAYEGRSFTTPEGPPGGSVATPAAPPAVTWAPRLVQPAPRMAPPAPRMAPPTRRAVRQPAPVICRAPTPRRSAPQPTGSVYRAPFGPRPPAQPLVPTVGMPVSAPPVRPMEFRFGIGDDLIVDVWKEPDLTTDLKVLLDGTIAPQLVGSVQVEGKSVDEVNTELRELYREYLKDPVVSVRVTAIHSDRVFVLGEVKTPSAVEITGPTSLVQAISQAGGLEEEYANKSTVRVIRKGPDGQPIVRVVNLNAVLCAQIPDPMMQRGDIVFIQARGVTKWDRTLGQFLGPFSVALGAAGATAAIIGLGN